MIFVKCPLHVIKSVCKLRDKVYIGNHTNANSDKGFYTMSFENSFREGRTGGSLARFMNRKK